MDKKDVVIYHGIRDGKYDVTIDGERRLLEPIPFPVQLKMTKAPLPLSGVNLIFAERERQKFDEGWTAEHDAEHTYGELADAAASYAMTPDTRATITAVAWRGMVFLQHGLGISSGGSPRPAIESWSLSRLAL